MKRNRKRLALTKLVYSTRSVEKNNENNLYNCTKNNTFTINYKINKDDRKQSNSIR